MKATVINICIIFSLSFLFACDESALTEEEFSFPEHHWHADSLKTIRFNVKDTFRVYSVHLIMDISESYPYRNMYLFITTSTPSGITKTDTIECMLAEPSGKWLGSKSGSRIHNDITLRKGLKFKEKGTYSITFEQAMRNKELPGIEKIRLSIREQKS
mgnify:CR=1 FL=1